MTDKTKTKAQLISELETLRQQKAELEAIVAEQRQKEVERQLPAETDLQMNEDSANTHVITQTPNTPKRDNLDQSQPMKPSTQRRKTQTARYEYTKKQSDFLAKLGLIFIEDEIRKQKNQSLTGE